MSLGRGPCHSYLIATNGDHLPKGHVMTSNYIPNGRGSAHSGIPFSAWQRHTPQCDARGNVTKGKGKPCVKCRASDATQEVRFNALAVSCIMTGHSPRINGESVRLAALRDYVRQAGDVITFMCPMSGQWVDVRDGEADRAVRGADGGRYVPGNVAMIDASANLARETVAHDGEQYVRDVRTAWDTWTRAAGVQTGTDMPQGWRELVRGGKTHAVSANPASITGGPYAAV